MAWGLRKDQFQKVRSGKKWVPKGSSRLCPRDKAHALDVGETAVAVDGPGAASSSGEAAGAADGGEAAPAVLEAADAVNIHYAHKRPSDLEDMWPQAPLHCPLDDPESDHDCDKSDKSVTTFPPGDSVVSEESQEESEGQEDAASAITERVRSKRRPKYITPAQQKLKSKWEGRNDADHVGNIGWLFGNWGARPADAAMRNHLDTVLKKQPAMVIGLAECQEETESVLRREPSAVADAPSAVADAPTPGVVDGFHLRPEFPYLTLRGKEHASVLIAVRDRPGSELQMLDFTRICHGEIKRRKSRQKAYAYSRSIIAKVTLPNNVGFLGKDHVVMVVHLHHVFANSKWPGQTEVFWDRMLQSIHRFNVQVLMGDFNMSLFKVIPELRSRGLQIDLGAWYPWKSLEGVPMSDSQGIFFVNLPGVYTLHKNIDDIHDMDPTGILARAPRTVDSAETRTNPATAGAVQDSDERANDARTRHGGFDHIEKCGPRHAIDVFSSQRLGFEIEMQRVVDPFDWFSRSCGQSLSGSQICWTQAQRKALGHEDLAV